MPPGKRHEAEPQECRHHLQCWLRIRMHLCASSAPTFPARPSPAVHTHTQNDTPFIQSFINATPRHIHQKPNPATHRFAAALARQLRHEPDPARVLVHRRIIQPQRLLRHRRECRPHRHPQLRHPTRLQQPDPVRPTWPHPGPQEPLPLYARRNNPDSQAEAQTRLVRAIQSV